MLGSGKQHFTEAIQLTKSGNYDEAIGFYDKAINSLGNVYSLVSRVNFTINEWEFFDDITFCEKNINSKCKNPNVIQMHASGAILVKQPFILGKLTKLYRNSKKQYLLILKIL